MKISINTVSSRIAAIEASLKSGAPIKSLQNTGYYGGRKLTATPGARAQSLIPKKTEQNEEPKTSYAPGSVKQLAGLFGATRRISERPLLRGVVPAETNAKPKPAPRLSLQKPVPKPRTVSLEAFYQIQSVRADEASGQTQMARKILPCDIDPTIYRAPDNKPTVCKDPAVMAMAAAFGNPGNAKLVDKATEIVAERKLKRAERAAKKAAAAVSANPGNSELADKAEKAASRYKRKIGN